MGKFVHKIKLVFFSFLLSNLIINSVYAQDFNAPVISSFTFSPDTIDITSQSQVVTVRVLANDLTGVKNTGLVYIQLSSNVTATQQTGWPKLVSGTVKNGTWEVAITIPKGLAPGDWSISMNGWSDSLNNSTNSYSASKQLVVKNSNPPDIKAPVISSFTFSPDTIDITSQSQVVTVRVLANDLTGVKNTGLVYIQLSSNVTATQQTGWPKLVSGTVKNGTWEVGITIPKGLAPGKWSISMNGWSDSLNNSTNSYSTSSQLVVINSKPPDVNAPVISSFTFSPDTLDITYQSKIVTVTILATDSTGVKNTGLVYVQLTSNVNATQQTGQPKLVSGTVKNGKWEVAITIPKGLAPGKWSISMNGWSDSLNNSTNSYSTNKQLVVLNDPSKKYVCPTTPRPILQTITGNKIFSSFCNGDTLKLNAGSNFVKGDTLKWYFNDKFYTSGIPITGSGFGVNFTDSGRLYVIKTDSLGCQFSSDTVTLVKNPIPAAPILKRDSANNLVSNYETNIWALNGNPLSQFNWPGINVKFIKPTTSGDYTVSTVQKGCYSLKSSYYFLVTDIINVSADEYI
jgi:predicted DNA binding CopG/RHH family protein